MTRGCKHPPLHSLAIRFEREEGAVLREERDRLESVFGRWSESAAPGRPYLYRLACLPDAQDLGEGGVERTRETVPLAVRTNERRTLSPRAGAMLRVDDQGTRGVAIINLVQTLNQLEESSRASRALPVRRQDPAFSTTGFLSRGFQHTPVALPRLLLIVQLRRPPADETHSGWGFGCPRRSMTVRDGAPRGEGRIRFSGRETSPPREDGRRCGCSHHRRSP